MMQRAFAFYAPGALLLAGLGVGVCVGIGLGVFWPQGARASVPGEGAGSGLAGVVGAMPPLTILPVARQVRIEQRFSIRITPGSPAMPPEMLDQIEQGRQPEHFDPRRLTQCVAIAGIAAVHGGSLRASPVGGAPAAGAPSGAAAQPGGAVGGAPSSPPTNRLLLFMRDQHIVVAALEKACRAEDFYSGFYVARNGDGLLCTDRDTLQSRSGASCKVKALRELRPLR